MLTIFIPFDIQKTFTVKNIINIFKYFMEFVFTFVKYIYFLPTICIHYMYKPEEKL